MEVRSWSKELALANAAFKRLFNNIQILNGKDYIKCGCVIGNRSRIFKNLENPEKNAMYKLPMIVIERNGINKNDDRLANVNNEVKYSIGNKKLNYNLYTPVPIDISYNVYILAKYQDHIDKIISNFIPFFNKDLYVRYEHPKYEGLEFTNQVIMDNSIQEDHPSELDSSQDDIITCTCGFTYKTYMFAGEQRMRYNSDGSGSGDDGIYEDIVPIIKNIQFGYYPVPLLSSHIKRMEYVDSMPSAVVGYPSPLSGPTTSAEYYPYVDRIIWHIDQNSLSVEVY